MLDAWIGTAHRALATLMGNAVRASTPEARSPWRWLVWLWLGWAALMLGYAAIAPDRFQPIRPDTSTSWTETQTRVPEPDDVPLARHVAWDSTFYVSIALRGYDDPRIRAVGPAARLGEEAGPLGEHPGWTPLSYAFFPAYPMAMRALAAPLRAFGMAPEPAVVLAGVLISLAGTLAAVIAIADLAATSAGAEPQDDIRAAAYLLTWPASLFLAQVYTEGLFLGLSFGALALARREQWIWAGALAALATLTRSTGVLLLLPLAWFWLASGGLGRLRRRRPIEFARLAALGAPAIAYLVWRAMFGAPFDFVQTYYFGRSALSVIWSWRAWQEALDWVLSGERQARPYYLIEAWGVVAALGTSALMFRREPALTLYGLAVFGIALTSGAAQGMHRYILSLPALFLATARLGRVPVFDRLWTFGNTLALALFALAFAFGFWAG